MTGLEAEAASPVDVPVAPLPEGPFRRLVGDAWFYATAYLLAAAAIEAAVGGYESSGYLVVSLVVSAGVTMVLVGWAWLRAKGGPPIVLDVSAVTFEQPRTRLRRRLLLGHQHRRGQLILGFLVAAPAVFWFVLGDARMAASGAAGMLTVLGFVDLWHAVLISGMEVRLGGTLVATASPAPRGAPELLVPFRPRGDEPRDALITG